MAITKILARHVRIDVGINYVLNGAKTNERILTAYHEMTPGNPHLAMKLTKEHYGKMDGVAAYHIIQSFVPGEIKPEQALEIAQEFCSEHLPGYEAVIGTHIDRGHVHNHIYFNSVNKYTGEKYHSSPKNYFQQIRGISDRLCEKYGLSIIMRGETSQAVKYYEWLREQRGQPTYRSMLTADIRLAVADAADYGHFLMIMENMGYEIKHGKHISFRLRGMEDFIRPGRKDAQYSEAGIRAAIEGSTLAIEQGQRTIAVQRKPYIPFRPEGKLKGFKALYVHYLYLLGAIGRQEYPPRMTPRLKREIMKFEQYRNQYSFLRKNGIESSIQLAEYTTGLDQRIASLTKQRTIINVKKKKQKPLYDALSATQSLEPVKELYASGVPGIENEFAEYMDALAVLEKAGIHRGQLESEKAGIYQSLADINHDIRTLRQELKLCEEISQNTPHIERNIQSITQTKEVEKDHAKRR